MLDPFLVSDWQTTYAPAGLVVTLTAADGRSFDVTFPLSADINAPDAYTFAEQLIRDVMRWEFEAERSDRGERGDDS